MKNKEVEFDDIVEVICEKLEKGGTVTFTPHGTSMRPMLRDGEDIVVLAKPNGRLRFLDVALYRRSNGQYVLHRVVDFGSNGSYIFCGDNQTAYEYGITDENILAVVVAFYRKGKAYRVTSLKYRIYSNFWYYIRHFRRGYSLGKRAVKKIINSDQSRESDDNEKTS